MTNSTTQFKNIRTGFAGLNKRERSVLVARLQGNTLSGVGKKLKLSAPRIMQIEKSAWDRVVNPSDK